MTSDYTKVHFAFEGKKQESDLCLTLLVCKMSLDVAFARVHIFPLSLYLLIGGIWTK
jgi:hypothetical protein